MWDVSRVSEMAIDYVKEHLIKEGWTVKTSKDVSGEQKWIGYDILVVRGNEFRFIEVKERKRSFRFPI